MGVVVDAAKTGDDDFERASGNGDGFVAGADDGVSLAVGGVDDGEVAEAGEGEETGFGEGGLVEEDALGPEAGIKGVDAGLFTERLDASGVGGESEFGERRGGHGCGYAVGVEKISDGFTFW